MDNKESIKRQPAIKLKVNDLINGKYKKEEGWKPNYVTTSFGKVSRVNIIAVLISKDPEQNSFLIDDGSASINVKSFEEKNFDVNIGDVVLVIGKPREWNSQKYILPEIVKKIGDKRWVEIRKKELGNRNEAIVEDKVEIEEEIFESPYQKVLDIIKGLDSGEGADYQEVLAKARLLDGEKIITSLLEQGEVFEIRSGRLKILE